MIKGPRGTFDIYGSEYLLREDVVNTLFKIAKRYGFMPITTPIFEEANLFIRSVGNESDIVNKEIYQFQDKKGRELALRPELTAPIMRSYIQHKMDAQNSFKRLCYYGPNFRYERPQAGRYRQFYQFGIESIGYKDPYYDAQIIALALNMLNNVGIKDYTLYINTLGNNEVRQKYNQVLKAYFTNHQKHLCSDCQTRIINNPLRIFDCKIDGDSEIVKKAPLLFDYLDETSLYYYQQLKMMLDQLAIKYQEDYKLVRGLDYYNDIVFEIKSNSNQAKNTIIGGGRYDHLCSQLGGSEQPSIGFAIGIERLLEEIKQDPQVLAKYQPQVDIYCGVENQKQRYQIYKLMIMLRQNYDVDCNYHDRKNKKNLETAIKLNAKYFIYFENEALFVKDLTTRTIFKTNIKELETKIKENYETK